jgi:prepilin-type N-terminal cleavage/methylation domain-containing protein
MRKSGFTLIELSIVLVIIGLIVGGILTGRDLIEAAKGRQAVRFLNDFDMSVNTFRAKFNCLPGDCTQAVAFGLGAAGGAGCNGNGNGAIDLTYDCGTSNFEFRNFFIHLSNANLILSNPQGESITFPIGNQSAFYFGFAPNFKAKFYIIYRPFISPPDTCVSIIKQFSLWPDCKNTVLR